MVEGTASGVGDEPKWRQGLEGPALAIAADERSPLRVNAGPGTGKTRAMMRRVARILEERRTIPEAIFMVTFTRVAAKDMIDNLAELGIPQTSEIRAGTLHRFCYDALSRQGVLETTGRNPRLLMKFEVRFLIEDLKKDKRQVRANTAFLKAFEAAWSRLQHETPGWPMDPAEKEFHRDLLEWLIEHDCMLVGELVTEMLRYLRNNPAAPERRVFDYVLVDEYQDLNRADQEVIDLLAENEMLTIIGDEDQAIYSTLRYAQPEGIREFHQTHPDTIDMALDVGGAVLKTRYG